MFKLQRVRGHSWTNASLHNIEPKEDLVHFPLLWILLLNFVSDSEQGNTQKGIKNKEGAHLHDFRALHLFAA